MKKLVMSFQTTGDILVARVHPPGDKDDYFIAGMPLKLIDQVPSARDDFIEFASEIAVDLLTSIGVELEEETEH